MHVSSLCNLTADNGFPLFFFRSKNCTQYCDLHHSDSNRLQLPQSYCSRGLLSSSSLCPKYLAVITVIVHTSLPVIQSPSFVFVRRPYALYTTPSPGLCYAQLNLMLLSSQQVRSRQMWPSPRKNHTGCCHCDRKFCLHFTSAGAAQGFVLQQKGFMS